MIISSTAWFALALHLPVILWAALLDDFATLNMWANRYLQPRLPAFLKSGKEWTTWVHHALISALVTLYVALWGLVLPDSWVVGARLGSGIALTLYGTREVYDWHHHAKEGTLGKWKLPYGWGIDGVMDVVGPILIHLWTWTL